MIVAREQRERRREEASEWCMLHAEGLLAENERHRFDQWIADPENAAAFEQATRIWQAMDLAAEWPEMIHIRTTALQSYGEANGARWRSSTARRWAWLGGTVAVLLLAFVWSYAFLTGPEIFKTGVGERTVAMLADGTRLSLDADTQVDVVLSSKMRELTLVKGRARFDVAKDRSRPFLVFAGKRAVLATGTQFTVELIDQKVRVVLIEGHVEVLEKFKAKEEAEALRVNPRGISVKQFLQPGVELVEAADNTSPGRQIAPTDIGRALSWEGGKLVFEDTDLRAAVERVNRYSATKVRLGNAGAGNVRLSGVFAQGDVAAFVEAATELGGLQARNGDGAITLYAPAEKR
ncbi:FecR family protein [Sphingobium aquiterrae]|uniref:FecR family protein n=1 Tax=Sphingobium aquiterrae TaxID=2038656 RepID=UPI0030190659